jgi:hypothetical protein
MRARPATPGAARSGAPQLRALRLRGALRVRRLRVLWGGGWVGGWVATDLSSVRGAAPPPRRPLGGPRGAALKGEGVVGCCVAPDGRAGRGSVRRWWAAPGRGFPWHQRGSQWVSACFSQWHRVGGRLGGAAPASGSGGGRVISGRVVGRVRGAGVRRARPRGMRQPPSRWRLAPGARGGRGMGCRAPATRKGGCTASRQPKPLPPLSKGSAAGEGASKLRTQARLAGRWQPGRAAIRFEAGSRGGGGLSCGHRGTAGPAAAPRPGQRWGAAARAGVQRGRSVAQKKARAMGEGCGPATGDGKGMSLRGPDRRSSRAGQSQSSLGPLRAALARRAAGARRGAGEARSCGAGTGRSRARCGAHRVALARAVARSGAQESNGTQIRRRRANARGGPAGAGGAGARRREARRAAGARC